MNTVKLTTSQKEHWYIERTVELTDEELEEYKSIPDAQKLTFVEGIPNKRVSREDICADTYSGKFESSVVY